MKTSLDVTLVTCAVLAVAGCSSSINALSQDGATDVPLAADGPTGGAGGGPMGTGGGSPGSGGHPGSGGVAISSDAGAGGVVTDAGADSPLGGGMDGRRDVGIVTGGASGRGGSGGSAATGGSASGGSNTAKGGSGGSTATGGVAIDAGTATGGGGGGTGAVCAGTGNVACPTGQLCDIVPGCGNVYTHPPSGICKPTGAAVVCSGEYAPVCGCDGRTYANDCARIAAGALKASEGSCGTDGGTAAGGCGYACRTVGGVTGWYLDNDLVCEADCLGCTATCSLTGTKSEGCYTDCPGAGCGTGTSTLVKYANCGGVFANAYLSWQAPAGDAGTGPALVVDAAAGSLRIWTNTAGFSPPSPPSNPTATYTLSSAQTADLFTRLTAVNLAALPHAPSDGWECYARLYVRLCSTCVTTTLDYPVPDSLAPEMDSVWSWFEQLAGTTAFTSPRLYCARTTP